jgi:hypothetical protein
MEFAEIEYWVRAVGEYNRAAQRASGGESE